VEFNWLFRVAVDTKLRRFGVETNPGVKRVAVETKLRRFAVLTWFKRLGVETNPGPKRVAVDTKLRRFGVEIKGKIEEASSLGSMKLLMYLSNPATVETS
jgi:hypothetical protein